MRSNTVHRFQVLRMHEKSCKFIAIFVEAEKNTNSHIVDSAFHGSVHCLRVITVVVFRACGVKFFISLLMVGLLEEDIRSDSGLL